MLHTDFFSATAVLTRSRSGDTISAKKSPDVLVADFMFSELLESVVVICCVFFFF